MFPKEVATALKQFEEFYQTPLLEAMQDYIKSDDFNDETIFQRLTYFTKAEESDLKDFYDEHCYFIDELTYQQQRALLSSSRKHEFINTLVLLGHILFYGSGVTMNERKAYICFQIAAHAKHPAALNNLGFMYATGAYLPKNLPVAFDYYEQAIKLGSLRATFNLFKDNHNILLKESESIFMENVYLNNSWGFTLEKNRKYDEAIQYYARAIGKIGCPKALCNLGSMYINQTNIENHRQLVYECYKLAVQRHPKVGYGVGICYLEGYGVSANLVKAEKYFLIASDKYGDAHYQLGIMYEDKCPIKSTYHFRQTAKCPRAEFAQRALMRLHCCDVNAAPLRIFYALSVTKGQLSFTYGTKWPRLEEILLAFNQENQYLLNNSLRACFSELVRERLAMKLHMLKTVFFLPYKNESGEIRPTKVFLHIFKYVIGDQIMQQFLSKKILTPGVGEAKDFGQEYRAYILLKYLEQRAIARYGEDGYMNTRYLTLFGSYNRKYFIDKEWIAQAHAGVGKYSSVVKQIEDTLAPCDKAAPVSHQPRF